MQAAFFKRGEHLREQGGSLLQRSSAALWTRAPPSRTLADPLGPWQAQQALGNKDAQGHQDSCQPVCASQGPGPLGLWGGQRMDLPPPSSLAEAFQHKGSPQLC